MTLNELKTGMIVVLANGEEYMVYKDMQTSYYEATEGDVIVRTDGIKKWDRLDTYNKDLTKKNRSFCSYDIVEVIQVRHPFSFVTPEHGEDQRKLLWKRHEKKKYTYAQLREILGEEFEVVG